LLLVEPLYAKNVKTICSNLNGKEVFGVFDAVIEGIAIQLNLGN
jgi:hypothetical protein